LILKTSPRALVEIRFLRCDVGKVVQGLLPPSGHPTEQLSIADGVGCWMWSGVSGTCDEGGVVQAAISGMMRSEANLIFRMNGMSFFEKWRGSLMLGVWPVQIARLSNHF
jgi:hypothetical protein